MVTNVAVLVGSLRQASLTRKAAHALMGLAPEKLQFNEIPIGDLALYNEELETESPPASWVRFRQRMKAADAVLFATPEYNRSVPGALKNAIDVGSRPVQDSVFKSKPAAVMSVSPGALGGFGANHHLRQSLVFLDMPVLQQPELYLARVDTLVDDRGQIASEDTKKLLQKFVEAFAAWIERNAG